MKRIVPAVKNRLVGIGIYEILFLLYFCAFYGHRHFGLTIDDVEYGITGILQVALLVITILCLTFDFLNKKLNAGVIKQCFFFFCTRKKYSC